VFWEEEEGRRGHSLYLEGRLFWRMGERKVFRGRDRGGLLF